MARDNVKELKSFIQCLQNIQMQSVQTNKPVEIVGQKVKDIRPMTKQELNEEGWNAQRAMAIELENGIVLYASQDEEGNGPGAIFGHDKTKKFMV